MKRAQCVDKAKTSSLDFWIGVTLYNCVAICSIFIGSDEGIKKPLALLVVASLFDAGISLQKGRPSEARSILLMLGFSIKKEDRTK